MTDNYLGYDALASPADAPDSGDAVADAGDPDVVPDAGEDPTSFPMANTDLPNLLEPVVGATQQEVDSRISAIFDQLFYGNEADERIYFEIGEDEAYIFDVNHDDTRADALGYGMMITVELDHQAEFDKIWAFTKNNFQYDSGALAGYFRSICQVDFSECSTGASTLGAFYIVTALFFAEGRWGNGAGIYNYGSEARSALDTMLNKEEQNGGVVENVTNLFDKESFLPQRSPDLADRGRAAPGSVMPAFFEAWGGATQDPFWTRVAAASREFLDRAVHPTTGLAPSISLHDGTVVAGEESFRETAYGVGLHIALDQAWYGLDPAQVTAANHMLNFFSAAGNPYPSWFSYSGEPQNGIPSLALIALNGAVAGISTATTRADFIRATWELGLPSGNYRFFDGVNQLMSLMYLGGVFRVY